MTNAPRIHGLVASTHTPFHADGPLNLTNVDSRRHNLDPDPAR
jgi:hypothetical protein